MEVAREARLRMVRRLWRLVSVPCIPGRRHCRRLALACILVLLARLSCRRDRRLCHRRGCIPIRHTLNTLIQE